MNLNAYEIAGVGVVVGAGIMAGGAVLVKYLAKKGVNVSAVEEKLDTGLQFAEKAADALQAFLPAPYNTLVKTIASYAAKTVETTEALTKAGLMTADQRKTAATSIIVNDLQSAGLPTDENVQKLISVAIDASALLLPGHIATTTSTGTTTAATAASSTAETATK